MEDVIMASWLFIISPMKTYRCMYSKPNPSP